MSFTLRAWLRYVVPFTALSVIALAPLVYVAWNTGAPADVPAARGQVRIAWILAGSACAFQLLLVAGVAPVVRSLGAGLPPSQLRAFTAGLRGLARGFVPWIVAIAAVLLGGLAFVVPGLILLVLVSLTGASDELGRSPQAAIADSVALAREHLPRMALLVGAIVFADLAIAFAAHHEYVPALAKRAVASKLVPIRTFVRVTALALVAVSPLAACALAAAYSRARGR